MKKVVLKKLTLENWRAQNRVIEFGEKQTKILGANGCGKSSLVNAFFWLLTGTDAEDRTNYDLFDHTKPLTYENSIPAVVEGVFDIDGEEYTFKRTAKQKWVRKRANGEYEKDKSDEYTYYIDGLAVSAKVYKERVEGMFAGMDKLKFMLNVRYFQMLDWRTLRKHLSDIYGIKDESELKGDYSSIEPLIKKFKSVELAKEKLKQEMKPLWDSLSKAEAEIEGMQAMLPSLEGVEEAERAIEDAKKRIEDIDSKILGLSDANKPYIEKRRAEEQAILEKESELRNAENEWMEEQDSKMRDVNREMADIKKHNKEVEAFNADIDKQRQSLNAQLDAARQMYQFYDEERNRLKKEKSEAIEKHFDNDMVCPTCGQPYPPEKMAELRAKFYEDRDRQVDAIITKGKRVRESRDMQENLCKSLEEQIANLPEYREPASIEAITAQYDAVQELMEPFENSQIYGILTNQIELMKSSLTVIPQVDSTELIAEKSKLNEEIAELHTIAARRKTYAADEAKIAAKRNSVSDTAVEYAKLKGLYEKCVEREREWASIVQERANKNLHYCQIKMTDFQKSGELIDTCTITIDGVDVSVANTARQIVAGIDLAEAIQTYAGLNLPLFIDNAEQICSNVFPHVENQTILTYVSEDHNTLTQK